MKGSTYTAYQYMYILEIHSTADIINTHVHVHMYMTFNYILD